MRWNYKGPKVAEYDPATARDGDMYFYEGGKLIYVGNGMRRPKRQSFFKRLLDKLKN